MIEFVGKSVYVKDYIMNKYIYNESNGLWYELVGEYYNYRLKK